MRHDPAMPRTLLVLLTALVAAVMVSSSHPRAQSSQVKAPLAERLGYTATEMLLIVNADDVGMSHAANVATRNGMEKGLITAGSIMVPCPWFEEIAEYARANSTLR